MQTNIEPAITNSKIVIAADIAYEDKIINGNYEIMKLF